MNLDALELDRPVVVAHFSFHQCVVSSLGLERLGIDVMWLSPVYRSPMDDNGYDIAEYRDIEPVFGTLDAFDEHAHRGHPVHYHAARGKYHSIDWCPTGGKSLGWLRDLLTGEGAGAVGFDELIAPTNEVVGLHLRPRS